MTLVVGVACLQLVQDRYGEGKRPLGDVFSTADRVAPDGEAEEPPSGGIPTGFTQIFPVHNVLFLTINRHTIPTNKGQVTTDLDKLAVHPLQGLGIVLPEIDHRLVTRAGILAQPHHFGVETRCGFQLAGTAYPVQVAMDAGLQQGRRTMSGWPEPEWAFACPRPSFPKGPACRHGHQSYGPDCRQPHTRPGSVEEGAPHCRTGPPGSIDSTLNNLHLKKWKTFPFKEKHSGYYRVIPGNADLGRGNRDNLEKCLPGHQPG